MTSTTGGPTLRQHQLAKELKILREEVGFTRAHVADQLRCSVEKIGHIERARNTPSEEFLAELLQLYGFSDRFAVLNEIRGDALRRGPFSAYGLPSWLKIYLGWEEVATEVNRFTLELVPGALQCELYSQELARVHGASPRDTERHMASQRERRARLERGDMTLSVVVSQALLEQTRHMGTAGVTQLRHLQEAVDIPTLRLQVLPFTRGAHPGMGTSFTILKFTSEEVGTLGYYDYAGGIFVNDQEEVAKLLRWYDCLENLALEPDETVRFIDEVLQNRERVVLL